MSSLDGQDLPITSEELEAAFQEVKAQIRADQETIAGLKRKKRLQLKAEREKNPRPDLDQYETRATFQKRGKRGKDRLGLRKVSRRKCNFKKPKRTGCFVIGGPKWPPTQTALPPKSPDQTSDNDDHESGVDTFDGEAGSSHDEEGTSDADRDSSADRDDRQPTDAIERHNRAEDDDIDEEEEGRRLTDDIEIGQHDIQPAKGTRQWLIDNTPMGERVPWPSDIQKITGMLNPENLTFNIEGVREEKCGCVKRCNMVCCRNAAEIQICETETCSVGAANCENRFRQRRSHLKTTPMGLGVFAARPIRTGDIVGQYYGKDTLAVAPSATYTFGLMERDDAGRQVYVSAEDCGSISRFVAHACRPNTNFVEVRGRQRPTIALVAQRDIPTHEEITVDYTGETGQPLWFQCQCNGCREDVTI